MAAWLRRATLALAQSGSEGVLHPARRGDAYAATLETGSPPSQAACALACRIAAISPWLEGCAGKRALSAQEYSRAYPYSVWWVAGLLQLARPSRTLHTTENRLMQKRAALVQGSRRRGKIWLTLQATTANNKARSRRQARELLATAARATRLPLYATLEYARCH